MFRIFVPQHQLTSKWSIYFVVSFSRPLPPFFRLHNGSQAESSQMLEKFFISIMNRLSMPQVSDCPVNARVAVSRNLTNCKRKNMMHSILNCLYCHSGDQHKRSNVVQPFSVRVLAQIIKNVFYFQCFSWTRVYFLVESGTA